MLVILTPQAMSDPTATAQELAKYAHIPGKPVLASWMGGESVRPGEEILDRAGIPTFAYPDTAARLFTLMWRSHYNLQALYETPTLPGGGENAAEAREAAGPIIDAARAEGRTVLTEVESKRILAAYGIPTVETRVAVDRRRGRRRRRWRSAFRSSSSCTRARSPTRPTSAACSSTWRMPTPSAARSDRSRSRCATAPARGTSTASACSRWSKLDGYELIVGSSLDPQFGPVLLFGTGGQLVEVFRDRALGLPPLNTTWPAG